MGLGSLIDVGLVRAREKAAAARMPIVQGIDPIEHSRTQATIPAAPKPRHGPTFEEVAEAYMADKLRHLRSEAHRSTWRQTLADYAYPVIGAMPIDEIQTKDVLAVLNPIWQKKCETASRLRGRIERILARAQVLGLRTGDNPASVASGPISKFSPAMTSICFTPCSTWMAHWWDMAVSHPNRSSK
jgi:hypothetical protein